MSAEPVNTPGRGRFLLLCGTVTATFLYFFAFRSWCGLPPECPCSTLGWASRSWNWENNLWRFSWLVLLVMVVGLIAGARRAATEPVTPGRKGLFWIITGLLLHFYAVRAGIVRVSFLSLPLLVIGGLHFTAGWKRARHFLFPLGLCLLLVPIPGVSHLTNYLWPPANRMAEQLFWLLGGKHYYGTHGFWGLIQSVSFKFFIPVILAALVAAKYCHHSVGGRLLIMGLALPVAFGTEVLRAAVDERLREMNSVYLQMPLFEELELLWVQALAGCCFFLACRLTGGPRLSRRASRGHVAVHPPR